MRIIIKRLLLDDNQWISWIRVIVENDANQYKEMVGWIDENIGYSYNQGPVIDTEDGGIKQNTFIFREDDAMAFKLRWL